MFAGYAVGRRPSCVVCIYSGITGFLRSDIIPSTIRADGQSSLFQTVHRPPGPQLVSVRSDVQLPVRTQFRIDLIQIDAPGPVAHCDGALILWAASGDLYPIGDTVDSWTIHTVQR
jgi:hypothetical protein